MDGYYDPVQFKKKKKSADKIRKGKTKSWYLHLQDGSTAQEWISHYLRATGRQNQEDDGNHFVRGGLLGRPTNMGAYDNNSDSVVQHEVEEGDWQKNQQTTSAFLAHSDSHSEQQSLSRIDGDAETNHPNIDESKELQFGDELPNARD